MTMADGKQPGVAFWATVAVACVLAYSLSFGPACRILSAMQGDDHADDIRARMETVYLPILWTRAAAPKQVRKAVKGYADSWLPHGRILEFTVWTPFGERYAAYFYNVR